MALWCLRAGRIPRHLAVAALVGVLGLVGCGQQAAQTDPTKEQPTAPDAGARAAVAPAAEALAGAPTTVPVGSPATDVQNVPFVQAVRAADNPPPDSNRPPDETVSHKSVYKILKSVMDRWDYVRFTTPEGKTVDYSATVETSLGTFKIALRPDLAPNHVRNFVALAEAGYYDGLNVDRICQEEENGRVMLQSIELGCPLGTGEPGNGSIGYWLKDEFQPSEKVTHEEGTVNACRSVEPDSASCRFSVLLNKAPALDSNYTVFGKVVEGLDVVRKIHAQPAIIEPQDQGAHRPEKAITITRVLIQRTER